MARSVAPVQTGRHRKSEVAVDYHVEWEKGKGFVRKANHHDGKRIVRSLGVLVAPQPPKSPDGHRKQ